MRFKLATVISVIALVLSLPAGVEGRASWRRSWSEEFNGRTTGAKVDPAKWRAEIGGSGWGNKEFEFYTDSPKNAYIDGKGSLVIKAIEETLPPNFTCWYGACRYTSARLTTKHTFNQTYGRFEARIKIPYGQGIWPAFWLLGKNIDTVGWPACGEIDIMENIGREPTLVHGTMHGPGFSGGDAVGASYSLPGGRRFADDYHIYAVEWEPEAIRWYVDGKLYQTRTPADLPAGTRWMFDRPVFVILNLAVGGAWPGNPDATTSLPQMMLVDYVRVYRR